MVIGKEATVVSFFLIRMYVVPSATPLTATSVEAFTNVSAFTRSFVLSADSTL